MCTAASIAIALLVAVKLIPGLTLRLARALIRRGALPAVRPIGSRNYFVDEADLRALFTPVVATPAPTKVRTSETERALAQLAAAGISVRP